MKKLTTFSLTLLSALVLSACDTGQPNQGAGTTNGNTSQAQPEKPKDPKAGDETKSENDKTQENGSENADPSKEEPKPDAKDEKSNEEVKSEEEKAKEEQEKAEQEKAEKEKAEKEKADEEKAKEDERITNTIEGQPGEHHAGGIATTPGTEVDPTEPPNHNENCPPIEGGCSDPRQYSYIDEDVLWRLNENFKHKDLFSLKLEGTNLVLSPANQGIKIVESQLDTLRENTYRDNATQKAIIGYAGYSKITENGVTRYTPIAGVDKSAADYYPDNDMQYDGKMYYGYNQSPNQALTGTVKATFSKATAELNMQITADNADPHYSGKRWELKDENGDTFKLTYHGRIEDGKLFIDNKLDGQFNGGLYGRESEALIGHSQSVDQSNEKSWKGAVGAKGDSLIPPQE